MDKRCDTNGDSGFPGIRIWCERVGLLLCGVGIAVAVSMEFCGRSFFCDEAAFVWNLETRTLRTLVATPLEWNQTAPLLYVYALKLLTMLFGSAEWVYRLPSLLAYAFLPVVVHGTAKRLFGLCYPWLCAGFCANLGVLLLYSNQAKPYMGEAVWTLAALAVHHAYRSKRTPWWGLAGMWSVLGMLGNPVWFAVAACMFHEGLRVLRCKDRAGLVRWLGIGCVFGICMGMYYFAWLSPVATSGYMQDFWKDEMLPWPVTFTAVIGFCRVLHENFFIAEFGKRALAVIPIMAASFVLTAKTHHGWALVVWLTLGAATVASCLDRFPVSMRLWVFAVPLCILLLFWTVERLAGNRGSVWGGVFLVGLAISNLGILRYWNAEKNPIWEGEEINDSVDFIREHLRDGESVYVYCASIPGFQFRNGYGCQRLGETSQDNVIWGSAIGENSAATMRDVEAVEDAGTCWIVMTHAFARLTKEFLTCLASSGSLEVVHESHGTPVYLYRNGNVGGRTQ